MGSTLTCVLTCPSTGRRHGVLHCRELITGESRCVLFGSVSALGRLFLGGVFLTADLHELRVVLPHHMHARDLVGQTLVVAASDDDRIVCSGVLGWAASAGGDARL